MNKIDFQNNNSKKNSIDDNINKKKVILYLIALGISGLVIRIIYFPHDVPILADGQGYFWYALDMSILKDFPKYNIIVNNGWPTLLSFFFNIIDDKNFLVFQNLQRFISVGVSVLTIIPIFLLCKRFVNWRFAMIAAAVFVVEPKLVLNSVLGTPEPLYIFLISTMLWLFFSEKNYKIYISFGILGLISLVRYEGLLLLAPISVMYFFRFRRKRKQLVKYGICIGLFILITFPMANIRNETMGSDGLISHVSAGPTYVQEISKNQEFNFQEFVSNGIINLVKFLGWIQIPFYIIFIPLGIFMIFKKKDYKILTIMLTVISILIPALYAYARGFEETKYLFPLYPIFAILSAYAIQKFYEKINMKKFLTVIIFAGLIFTSMVYLDWKSISYDHEREAFQIMMDLSKIDMYVNMDMGKSGYEFAYIHWARVYENPEFPDTKNSFEFKSNIKFDAKSVIIEDKYKHKMDQVERFFLAYRDSGKTHLLIDNYNNGGDRKNNDILKKIFSNEEKFPFLEKIYDSKENGYEYHVKLFKINYKIFENGI